MDICKILVQEFTQETNTTIRIFEALADDIFEFKPHEKSKNTSELANHIASIASWVPSILATSELDWEKYTPQPTLTNKTDLVSTYKDYAAKGIAALETLTEDVLSEEWTMRKGDYIFFTLPKYAVLRNLILNHTIHHRAQLGTYLRSNDLRLPASYVASADENL